MLRLTRAYPLDPLRAAECLICPESIESVESCTVGERANGSLITTKTGNPIHVWESVEYLRDRLCEPESTGARRTGGLDTSF